MPSDSYFLFWLPFLALTPAERWKAAGRQFQTTSFVTERWFIAAAVVVLVVLTLLLIAVNLQKRRAEKTLPSWLLKFLSLSRVKD